MFDGVDIKTNAVITDCDQMKKYETIKGKRFAIEKPEGYYRASAEEVAISLYKLIETLSKDYVQFLRNVKLYTELSEQFGEEIHFKNLNAAKQGARLIKAWLNNLLKDFPSHCNNELIREDICQALLAAINKIADQRSSARRRRPAAGGRRGLNPANGNLEYPYKLYGC
jgi:hypothetical protein